jgi:hypothetical protein
LLIERVVKARVRSRIPGGDASKVGPVASAVAEAVYSSETGGSEEGGFETKHLTQIGSRGAVRHINCLTNLSGI